MKNGIILAYLFFGIKFGYSQRNANWYFGNGAGITFTTASPSAIGGGASAIYDNSSTISDLNGNLLFYSNGLNVYNRLHQVMPNGSGLLGNNTAGQCALIVPIPCSLSRYAVFYPTEFSSPGMLRYSYVDMSLNNGFGAVEIVGKNSVIGSGFTEKLCAYYNQSGNFYWVVTHKWGSADFVAIRVDATGVTTTSVVSTVGSIHSCGVYSGAHDAMGQLTISQDGLKLANALTCTDVIELFDFNVVTGQVSNPIQLLSDGANAWGTAFSGDSKMLYTNSIFGSAIYQFDVSLPTALAIQNSRNKVGDTFQPGYNFGYMELGPDNKIYIPRANSTWFAAITSPNSYSTACGYNFSYLSLSSGGPNYWGISRIAYNIPSNPLGSGSSTLTYALSSPTFCAGQTVTITLNSPNGNYLWNQTVSGNSMTFAPTGAFTVAVSEIGGCKSTTLALLPEPSALPFTISSPTFCSGQTVTVSLNVSGGTYMWNQVSGGTTMTFAPISAITISVNQINGCRNTSLSLSPSSGTLPFSISSSTFCAGQAVTVSLNVSGGSYLWNQTIGSTSMTFAPMTTMSILVSEVNGCNTNTIILTPKTGGELELTVHPNPLCIGQIATLTALGSGNYVWNNIQGSSQFTFVVNTTNSFTVSNIINCNSAQLNLIGNVCNAISDFALNSKVSIQPNPVSEFLKVECNFDCGSSFRIVDELGKVRIIKKDLNWASRSIEINVTELGSGTYFLCLENGICYRFYKL